MTTNRTATLTVQGTDIALKRTKLADYISLTDIARSREQAQVQADDMISKAREAIAAETAQARIELRREVADLAVSAASKIVRANLDRQAQSRLIEEKLAEATSGAGGSTPISPN